MYEYFFTVRSITTAQRGAAVLDRAGIRNQIARTPKSISAQGCGYRLMVRAGDEDRAAELLREAEINFSASYHMTGDGEWEAAAL